MTRASAANADGCPAGYVPKRGAGFAERTAAKRPWRGALSRAAFSPFAVATAIGIAILAVVAVAAKQLGAERDLVMTAAARDVDIRATLLAARLDAALSAAPQASPAEVFRIVLNAHPDERLAHALLIDRAGQEIAIDPPDAPRRLFSEFVSAGRPQTPSRSGVVRLRAGPDGEQFAAVRELAATGGSVAFASPVADHLGAFSRTAGAAGALPAATVALLIAAGALYAAEQRAKLKRAREEQAGRDRMELALDRGRCGLWTWDLDEDRISWSASMFGVLNLAERPIHWSRAELQALMHPDDGDLAAIAHAALARGGQIVEVEFRMRAADGRWVWLRKRAELVIDAATGAASLVGVAFALSESGKQTEKAAAAERLLTSAASKADAAERAKAEFLANMSHELRTPLNAIIGFSQLMGAQAFGPLGCEKYRDYCAHILSSGRHLLNVLSDILDMSRLEAGRERLTYACVFADEAVRRAAQDVAAIAREKGVALAVDVRADLALEADAGALERILTMLLRNAVKFAPDGGSVEIGAEAAADEMHFYVRDNGPGVAAEDVARLGRPFEQGRAVMANGMKGPGLGLAIASSLAKLHGGTLRLASREGEGAVAVVALPRVRRHAHSIVAEAA